ncbi:MAG: class I SAM-dependent methyltransferase, partial [Myxococcota bacterium]|jgi:ubiquinone/menaquinone biosynthesis C-methylase UbiE|nr:class I SAM-dependent methyltransferase [Myxococcota bacterium]
VLIPGTLAVMLTACGERSTQAPVEESEADQPEAGSGLFPQQATEVADREGQEEHEAGYLLYEQVERTYPSHTDFDFAHQLEVRSEDPTWVLKRLALTPGMTVADIGSGSGFYTFRFAAAVGAGGRVHSLDIQLAAIRFLEKRMADATLNPHGNVTATVSRIDDTTLLASSVDLGFIGHADFYAYDEQLDENQRMLESCYRTVRPGGRMVVLQDMRIVKEGSAEAIVRNFERVGFVSESLERDPAGHDVLAIFRRPVSEP